MLARALAAQVCLTARHSGGFALFQTNSTSYGIKESPYQGGRGDIVREFTASCRRAGISPCLYLINAWDCWEASEPNATGAGYLEAILGMLTELMNRDTYGKIGRFWFDEFGFSSHPGQSPPGLFPGAWEKIVAHVRAGSPGTMMLPGPDGCKNRGEGGAGQYPVLNYVPITPGRSRSCQNASVHGEVYAPFESDVSIENPGDAWFWHRGHPFYNATSLWELYLASAGRGSTMILNVPPNTSGVMPTEYVRSVRGAGDAIAATFGTSAGSAPGPATGKCDGSVLALAPARGGFDAIRLVEDLRRGQNILAFRIELLDRATNAWHPAALSAASCAGQTVGSLCVAVLANGTAASLGGAVAAARFRCTATVHGTDPTVSLRSMSLHRLRLPPPRAREVDSY